MTAHTFNRFVSLCLDEFLNTDSASMMFHDEICHIICVYFEIVLVEKQFNFGTRRLVLCSQRDRSTSPLVYVCDVLTWRSQQEGERSCDAQHPPVGDVVRYPRQQARGQGEVDGDRHVGDERSPLRTHVLQHCSRQWSECAFHVLHDLPHNDEIFQQGNATCHQPKLNPIERIWDVWCGDPFVPKILHLLIAGICGYLFRRHGSISLHSRVAAGELNGRLTEDVHHGEAVVEGEAEQEPADAEGPEAGGKGGGAAGDDAHHVGADEGRHTAEAVRHPAEEQATQDGAAEEDRLRHRAQGPIQYSSGVITKNHGKPKLGWPDRESNPDPPECESCELPQRHLARYGGVRYVCEVEFPPVLASDPRPCWIRLVDTLNQHLRVVDGEHPAASGIRAVEWRSWPSWIFVASTQLEAAVLDTVDLDLESPEEERRGSLEDIHRVLERSSSAGEQLRTLG
ncbi:hypothetical protein PR048_029186 [Dryococelus australis]|uniref:Uncharacterized protein n=1 Tax=Dryococelus australis TaxID=614101 RepID=A0ABQ9GCN2_9NEOP|nr:hypothetical protein PR048_029186 [Dryococelus australis]